MFLKKCSRCGELKVGSEFHNARRAADGLQTYCKQCQLIVAREQREAKPHLHRTRDRRYRQKDPDKIRAKYRRWDLKTSYGITPQEYDAMLEAQGGVCAICGAAPMSERAYRRRLAVDHDHETGRVRRLLCGTCNRALGLFEENPDWLRQAVHYVEEVVRNARLV